MERIEGLIRDLGGSQAIRERHALERVEEEFESTRRAIAAARLNRVYLLVSIGVGFGGLVIGAAGVLIGAR